MSNAHAFAESEVKISAGRLPRYLGQSCSLRTDCLFLTQLGCSTPTLPPWPRTSGWNVNLGGFLVQEQLSWASLCILRRESCAWRSVGLSITAWPTLARALVSMARPLRTRSGKVRGLARPARASVPQGWVSAELFLSKSIHIVPFIFSISTLPLPLW